MLRSRSKLLLFISILISLIILISVLIWLFFPIILKTISPTWYTLYSLNNTIKTHNTKISTIEKIFDFSDSADSNTVQITADFSDITLTLDNNALNLYDVPIDLSELHIKAKLLHGNSLKQASIDADISLNDLLLPITLYTDVDKTAFTLNDESWMVNNKDFGAELSSLGLPIADDIQLNLSFLFPDIYNDEDNMETVDRISDFVKSLRFNRNLIPNNIPLQNVVAMTTITEGFELTFFINDLHLIQAVLVTINSSNFGEAWVFFSFDESETLTLDVQTDNFSLSTKGLLHSTDDSISISLEVIDFSSSDFFVQLLGNYDFVLSAAALGVYNISLNAQPISDFDFNLLRFKTAFLMIIEVFNYNEVLMDLYGHQLIDFSLKMILGEWVGDIIINLLGDRLYDLTDFLIDLLRAYPDNIRDFIQSRVPGIIFRLIEQFLP
ncbi:MAG: hypothetical protein LBC73_05330 [Oscillospiraceae bacterium]|nr:hypothetical protein [Oscillospiraceae bacterium]